MNSSNYNALTGNDSENNNDGICLYSSSYNNLANNNTCGNIMDGIHMEFSPSNTLTGNTCENNFSTGIGLHSSPSNTLTGNTCSNNICGIVLSSSPGNTLTLNYLLNNTAGNAYGDNTNYWDKDGKGNYWSDWQSPDSNGDGIVDQPRSIMEGSNVDHYPLVIPIKTPAP